MSRFIFQTINQSWVQRPGAPDNGFHAQGWPTKTLAEWETFRKRNEGAKLVCLDVAPYGTSQAPNRPDILNIGGFSDSVFEVISQFAAGRVGGDAFVTEIEAVAL